MTTRAGKALRFGIFCRVSTPRQEEKGESLPVQRKRLSDYVHNIGGTVVREYVGQESGKRDNDDRRLMAELLRDVRTGRIDAVAVRALNRFGRNDDESRVALAMLHKHGVEFHADGKRYDYENPTDALIVKLQTAVAQFTVDLYSGWAKDSAIEKAKRGELAGSPPYGRIYEGVVDGKAKWAIGKTAQRMMSDACTAIESGSRLRPLAERLSIKYGERVHAETLRRRIAASGSTFTQRGIACTVPALISDERVSRVLRLLSNRKAQGRRSLDGRALRGRLRCSTCGSLLDVSTSHGVRRVRHLRNARTGIKCWSAMPHYDDLENDFFYVLGSLLCDEGALRAAVDAYYAKTDSRTSEIRAKRDAARSDLRQLEAEHAKWMRAYVDTPDGASRERMKAEIGRFDQAIPALASEIDAFTSSLATSERPRDLDAQVAAMMDTLRGAERHTPLRWSEPNKQAWAAALFGAESLKYKDGVGIYLSFLPDGSLRWEAAGRFGVFKGSTTKSPALYEPIAGDDWWVRIDGSLVGTALSRMRPQQIGRRENVAKRGKGGKGGGGSGTDCELSRSLTPSSRRRRCHPVRSAAPRRSRPWRTCSCNRRCGPARRSCRPATTRPPAGRAGP